MKKKVLTSLAGAMLLAGCATAPEKIQSSSVSPLRFKDYTCNQLVLEQDRLNRRATELHASLKKTADDDGAQMAIGAILFWPALFFLEGGDGAEAAEYSRIKGEREAIEIAAIQRDCSIATAQETPKVEAETKPDS